MDEHPNIATFFNLMTQMPLEGITPMVPHGRCRHRHACHSRWRRRSNPATASVPLEHISHWLDKYDGKISSASAPAAVSSA
jgi:hypothetical protein